MIQSLNRQLEEAITNFFCSIAHSTTEHRAWLRSEFEHFWGFELSEDKVAPFLEEPPPEDEDES